MDASETETTRKERLARGVRALRAARGISQRELANAISVDIKTIGRIEGAQMLPNLAMIQDLADYFAVPVGVVLGQLAAIRPDREQGEREQARMWSAIRELHGAVQELLAIQKLAPLRDQGAPDNGPGSAHEGRDAL